MRVPAYVHTKAKKASKQSGSRGLGIRPGKEDFKECKFSTGGPSQRRLSNRRIDIPSKPFLRETSYHWGRQIKSILKKWNSLTRRQILQFMGYEQKTMGMCNSLVDTKKSKWATRIYVNTVITYSKVYIQLIIALDRQRHGKTFNREEQAGAKGASKLEYPLEITVTVLNWYRN
jgi:hypothetical protein